MEPTIWAKIHGATVHFPLALALGSSVLDSAAFALGARPLTRDLHAAGYWMMVGGALGSIPAVMSGLFMTKGSLLGHGSLRMHHLFAWPVFALLIGLAVWRVCAGQRATRPMFQRESPRSRGFSKRRFPALQDKSWETHCLVEF